MGAKTKIQWTEASWNPIRGCSKVSAGCTNCYAETMAARFSGPGRPYEGTIRDGHWNGQIRFEPDHLSDPLRWTRPRRVFVNSMSDLFHPRVSNELIAAIFGVMAAAPQHCFQILTKRPERMPRWFEWLEEMARQNAKTFVHDRSVLASGFARRNFLSHQSLTHQADVRGRHDENLAWPLPNVWLGVSVEDQPTADYRIPLLLETPSAIRWVSYEPALGAAGFRNIWRAAGATQTDALLGVQYPLGEPISHGKAGPRLDWIVIGGESGPKARRFDAPWLRQTIRDCRDAGTPLFVKQLGARFVDEENGVGGHSTVVPEEVPGVRLLTHPKGGDPDEWDPRYRVRQFPKEAP